MLKKKIVSLALSALMMASALPLSGVGTKVLADDDGYYDSNPNAGIRINAANFPDAAFRNHVADEYDMNSNGIISEFELRQKQYYTMWVNDSNVRDITGIELLDLWGLNVSDCSLTSLDLSQNTNLSYLNCSNNNITSLNVANNVYLTDLDCSNNAISSLNLANNTSLQSLDCSYNRLTSLNVSHNIQLNRLICNGNNFTRIDISNVPALMSAYGGTMVNDPTNGYGDRVTYTYRCQGQDSWDYMDYYFHVDFGVSVNGNPGVANGTDPNKLVVWCWNEELELLADKYYDGDAYYVKVNNTYYIDRLAAALASGEGAPDIFLSDGVDFNSLINDSHILPMSELGINRSELSDMFEYTLDAGTTSDGQLKALCYSMSPAGVIYNRTLTQNYFGVSSPEDVQPYFATWDAVINSARTVNSASNGRVQLVNNVDDMSRSYYAMRSRPWVSNEQFKCDSTFDSIMDICSVFANENLTPEVGIWSDPWAANMTNETIVSYWGPRWFLSVMGLNEAGENPTYGNWGFVKAPTNYSWGDSYLMATTYCTNKTAAAEFIRAIAVNPSTRTELLSDGYIVNSVSALTAASTNPAYNIAGLGGQNPFGLFVEIANNMNGNIYTAKDNLIQDIMSANISLYMNGQYSNSDETFAGFLAALADEGFIRPRSSVSDSGVSGFVERLYTEALDRPSDPNGMQDWTNRVMTEGYSGASVAQGFLFSPEFLNRDMSNGDFLDILYRVFFDREADEGGKTNWLNLMAGGATKQEVINGFINSVEWANVCLRFGITSGGNAAPNITVQPSDDVIDFATRLYSTCLGRNPDQEGLMNWANQLANMQISGSAAAHGFFFSAEFTGANISDSEYVMRLYRTFMGREYDQGGYDNWMNVLANGGTREDVFNGFAGSAEWATICAGYGILK